MALYMQVSGPTFNWRSEETGCAQMQQVSAFQWDQSLLKSFLHNKLLCFKNKL